MEEILILSIITLGLGSLITSFIAIYQILTNEFLGPKLIWIAISMIGFIGPIIWLVKGKKLLSKKK